MAVRKIVRIDDQKCDGCGQCVPNCAEGALAIVNGKARLIKESYCDGLGACLGKCPRGAITVEDRDAEAFHEAQAHEHLAARKMAPRRAPSPAIGCKDMAANSGHDGTWRAHRAGGGAPGDAQPGGGPAERGHVTGGCPGSRMMHFAARQANGATASGAEGARGQVGGGQTAPGPAARGEAASDLGHWPIQLALLPVKAPFYEDAELVLAADCTAAVLPDFHRRFLKGRALAVCCPKLDDLSPHVEKLAEILRSNSVRGLVVVHMEVPCCGGIVRLAEEAARLSGRSVPVRDITVGIRGAVLSDRLGVLGSGQ